MDGKVLLDKIVVAKQELVAAEQVLDELIRSLEVVPRWQKTAITQVVSDALQRLAVARTNVTELEQLATLATTKDAQNA